MSGRLLTIHEDRVFGEPTRRETLLKQSAYLMPDGHFSAESTPGSFRVPPGMRMQLRSVKSTMHRVNMMHYLEAMKQQGIDSGYLRIVSLCGHELNRNLTFFDNDGFEQRIQYDIAQQHINMMVGRLARHTGKGRYESIKSANEHRGFSANVVYRSEDQPTYAGSDLPTLLYSCLLKSNIVKPPYKDLFDGLDMSGFLLSTINTGNKHLNQLIMASHELSKNRQHKLSLPERKLDRLLRAELAKRVELLAAFAESSAFEAVYSVEPTVDAGATDWLPLPSAEPKNKVQAPAPAAATNVAPGVEESKAEPGVVPSVKQSQKLALSKTCFTLLMRIAELSGDRGQEFCDTYKDQLQDDDFFMTNDFVQQLRDNLVRLFNKDCRSISTKELKNSAKQYIALLEKRAAQKAARDATATPVAMASAQTTSPTGVTDQITPEECECRTRLEATGHNMEAVDKLVRTSPDKNYQHFFGIHLVQKGIVTPTELKSMHVRVLFERHDNSLALSDTMPLARAAMGQTAGAGACTDGTNPYA